MEVEEDAQDEISPAPQKSTNCCGQSKLNPHSEEEFSSSCIKRGDEAAEYFDSICQD
jgi:hypothetical protein